MNNQLVSFELRTPRDRSGTFEPQIIKKHQASLSDEIEQKILSIYGVEMSYRNISSYIKEMYAIELSIGTLADITDKMPEKVRQCGGCGPWIGSIPSYGWTPSITKYGIH